MSLKAFHVAFVCASLALTVFFAVWALLDYFSPTGANVDLVYAGLSVLAGIGLIVYGRYFLKKLKHISYL